MRQRFLIPFLLTASLWIDMHGQGPPQYLAQGSISGTLKNAGAPAEGVRVAAMVISQTETEPNAASVLVSLTQTDASGRYRLENLPPGRYYVTAGLVSAPTYYPGFVLPVSSSVVTVSAGATLVGYDFSIVTPLDEGRRFLSNFASPPSVPVRIVTEDGNTIPRTTIPWLVIARSAKSFASSEAIGVVSLFLPGGEDDYSVSLSGLPLGYALRSIKYRNVDVGPGPFRINPAMPDELVLTVAATPLSTIQGMKVRGKVLNVAPEWPAGNRTVLLLSKTENVIETPLKEDGTFEFTKAPAGVYQVRLAGFTQGYSLFPTVAVANDDVSDVVMDLRNNPFPEYPGGSYAPVFTQSEKTVRGIVTQAPTPIGNWVVYFRMAVKNETAGATTPWAVLMMTRMPAAKLSELLHLEVGAPATVEGSTADDGSNRLSIDARGINHKGAINGIVVPGN